MINIFMDIIIKLSLTFLLKIYDKLNNLIEALIITESNLNKIKEII